MTSAICLRRTLLAGLSVLALTAVAAQPARANDAPVAVHHAQNITYMNGGVSRSEEAYMHKQASQWPLRMVFSERRDKEFLADVALRITDGHGKTDLQLDQAGPMTFAKLPQGQYRVAARYQGKTETQNVVLDGKSGRDLYFHWKGQAAVDPFDGKTMGGTAVPG